MGNRLSKIYTRTGDDGGFAVAEDRASCATSARAGKGATFPALRLAAARAGASLRQEIDRLG
jgi:hypothetical protein